MAFDEHNTAWADEFKELYASLSPEEYRAAMESTPVSYTHLKSRDDRER